MDVSTDERTPNGTSSTCRTVGISKNNLFWWLEDGTVSNVERQDWRGSRLFTLGKGETIKTKTNHLTAMSRGG